MQESGRGEKPKIPGPKPAIPTKPKHVPPVNLKGEKVVRAPCQASRRQNLNELTPRKPFYTEESSTFYTQHHPNNSENAQVHSAGIFRETHSAHPNHQLCSKDEIKSSEKCDNFNSNGVMHHVTEKPPNSPSTVCCSILSNVGTDCCAIIINPNKKGFNTNTITKVDSIDSNSSDSGGFKEFLQRDMLATQSGDVKFHQREPIKLECAEKRSSDIRDQMSKSYSHQRQSSQPDEFRTFSQHRPNFVASAQALEQFVPQTNYARMYLPKPTTYQDANVSSKGSDEIRPPPAKPRIPLIPPSQFQNTTKKLEAFLSKRLENEKLGRKACLIDGETSQDVDQKMLVQKQIQQRLQADLQRTVKEIQEKQSIELRLPQNRKWTESNRSQPAIGLKHTPKSRC